MKKFRLHQYLSKTAEFKSKKEIWDAINNGEIFVNDMMTRNPDFQLRLTKPVFYKGKQLTVIRDHVYYLLNKPEGFLSSKLSDYDKKMGKRSVFSLLSDVDEKIMNTIFCVGRLDEDSSGLLILTNDGNFSHKTVNPEFSVKKEYKVFLESGLSEKDKQKIENGVEITLEENGAYFKHMTKPCTIIYNDSMMKSITMTLQEGKKREIRRMMEAIGNKVLRLERISIGKLKLEEEKIPVGHYKTADKDYILSKLR